MNIFAKITANGNELVGFRSIHQLGGEDLSDCIELVSFSIGADRTVSSSGQVSGSPDYRRLILSKRLDAASPVLLQALGRGEVVELKLKVFNKDANTGVIGLEFEIEVADGRLSSVDWDGVSGSGYAEETVQLAYGSLTVDNHAGMGTSAKITTGVAS